MGLFFWFAAMTAYPFVIGRLVHDPFIHATKSTVIEKRFCRREGSRMNIPKGSQFTWITVHSPAAVAHDACPPMTFFSMVDALPIMGAAGGFCSRYCWSGRRFCWLRFWICRFWLCWNSFSLCRGNRLCCRWSGRNCFSLLRWGCL